MTLLTPSESTDNKIDPVQLQVLSDAVENFKIKVKELRDAGVEDYKKEQLEYDEQEEIRNFFLTASYEEIEDWVLDIIDSYIRIDNYEKTPTENSLIVSLTYITDEKIQKKIGSRIFGKLFFEELIYNFCNLNLLDFYGHKFINLVNISKIYLYYKNNSKHIINEGSFFRVMENLAYHYMLEILQNSDIQVIQECNTLDLPMVFHKEIHQLFRNKIYNINLDNIGELFKNGGILSFLLGNNYPNNPVIKELIKKYNHLDISSIQQIKELLYSKLIERYKSMGFTSELSDYINNV